MNKRGFAVGWEVIVWMILGLLALIFAIIFIGTLMKTGTDSISVFGGLF